MAPSSPHISCQLRQLIYYHLDNNLLRNALFLAGRLHAFEPRSSEAVYLLSFCYLQAGQSKSAWETSKNPGSRGTHLGCSYVYAQACLDLGKYLEGITALERSRNSWASRNTWNKHSESRRQSLPDAAAVLSLQGKLWQAHKDPKKAIDCYVEALKRNPFLWDAFLGLCETGANLRVANIYNLSEDLLSMIQSSSSEDVSNPDRLTNGVVPLQAQSKGNTNIDPFLPTRNDDSMNSGSSPLWEKLNGGNVNMTSMNASTMDGMETPVAQNESEDLRVVNGGCGEESWEPPLAPARKSKTIQSLALNYDSEPPKMKAAVKSTRSRTKADTEEATPVSKEISVPSAPQAERKRNISGHVAHTNSSQNVEPGAPQRRSVRLFNQIRPAPSKFPSASSFGTKEAREIKKVKSTGLKTRSTASASTMGRVVSGNRKLLPESSEVDGKETRSFTTGTLNPQLQNNQTKPSANIDKSKEIEAVKWILELLSQLAGGYFSLCKFRCLEAIQLFNSVPQNQRESPWALAQIGRAYYEQAMYGEAAQFFVRVRTIAPSRIEDMEVYSTVLWHLKNEVELAYLAHELMEIDRLSPQAWCAIGNSFSLQSDHDQALKCFKRATQLDPSFAYAFTLQGHEHVSNEDHNKALDAYRHGISADTRHYNAWYGLGRVYEKMGKLEFAEHHYRTAAEINPTNAVLVCCIGMILDRMGKPKEALLQFSHACELSPNSVLARMRKARSLMRLRDLNSAHVELKILKDRAPDDSSVHYLLGNVCRMLNDKSNAIKHFTTALNLDPKAAQFIKDAMETLGNPDDYDDDMT